MTEIERINKNLKIKASQLETKKRRKTQSCSVYTVKIDESSLNKKHSEYESYSRETSKQYDHSCSRL